MSHATAIAAPASQEVSKPISIGQLFRSEMNPRKTVDAVFLAQLASSIAQIGIQVPLIVRPVAKSDDGLELYEIIAGHRRFFAAETLKLAALPCIVRDMDDDEAREIMLVENLQREDLDPLEQAEAYGDLLATLGDAKAIAARVGKPIEHVTRVLKLRTLSAFSRQALGGKLITIDHALLLAKLAAAEQEKALRYVLDPNETRKDKTEDIIAKALKEMSRADRWAYWQPESVVDLKAFVERNIKLELKRAPWDLADADLLPSAGACASCEKNTAANTALFGDLAIKDATCTDAVCFNAKRDAFVQIQLKAVAEAGKDAVRISWKFTGSKPRALDAAVETGDGLKRYLAQTFKAGQWIEAKKGSCDFIRTGVSVDFEESAYGSVDAKKKPGMKLSVCVAPKCKAHKKEWEKAAHENTNASRGYDPKAEQEKRELEEFLVKEEHPIRLKVWAAIVSKLDAKRATRLVADNSHDSPALRKALLKDLPSISGELLEALVVFTHEFSHHVRPNGYWMTRPGGVAHDRKDLWALAKAAGADADAIAAKHFHDAGSIAPAADPLYPKGIPWPKRNAEAKQKLPSPVQQPKAPAKPKAKPAPKAKIHPVDVGLSPGTPKKKTAKKAAAKKSAAAKKGVCK